MKKLLILMFLSWPAWAETPPDPIDAQIDKLNNNCVTDTTNLTKLKNCMASNHESRIDVLQAEFSFITLDGWRELGGAPTRIRGDWGNNTLYNWHQDHWDDTLGRHINKDWLKASDFAPGGQAYKQDLVRGWRGLTGGIVGSDEVGPYDQRVYYESLDCTPTTVAGEIVQDGYLDNDKIGINHGWPVFDLIPDGANLTWPWDLITSEVQLGPIEGSSRVELFWHGRWPGTSQENECVPTTLDGTYWSIDVWEPMAGNNNANNWFLEY